jgi:putative oxidoreductase
VQRFFSRFPDGPPGAGLLLLRIVAAVTAMRYGVAQMTALPVATLDTVTGALSIASSLAVLVGLFTPGSAAVMAVAIAWSWVRHSVAPLPASAAVLTIADAVAISLLGPGAYSIDTRLFGPREIVIPRDTRAPRD